MKTSDKEERARVKAMLGLHPIKDAVSPLKFWIKKEDIEKGVPKDFTGCANTLAVERVTGFHGGIVTFRKVCYVPVDKGDGKIYIERYSIRKKLHKQIINFDKLGTFEPGEYTLYPPTKHETLKQKKKTGKAIRERNKTKPKKAKAAKQPKELSFLDVRNGVGRANLVVKSLLAEQSPKGNVNIDPVSKGLSG